jgi:hypothetical protein
LPTRERGVSEDKMKPRERYQQGSVVREERRRGEDVWTFRGREINTDGSVTRRKSVIGTVADLHTKAAALKACEFFRSTINRKTRTPRTVAELVDH